MNNLLDILKKNTLYSVDQAKNEIRETNKYSERYGLSLSEADVEELVKCRKEALANSGRVEFAGGILPKLIYAFCDSPYIQKDDYVEVLTELQEAFYYFKTESLEVYTDDEIISFMVKIFNGKAQGSTEYLWGTSIEALCRYVLNPAAYEEEQNQEEQCGEDDE